MNGCCSKSYITPEEELGIKNFKYKGGSDSITYVHCWSPLAEGMVKYVFPKWLAPNLITLIGFLFVMSGFLITLYLSPDLQSDLPRWVFFMLWFDIFAYQLLDNSDGKQARATQNSSPLGMLFDHGTDSLSCWLICIMMLNVLKAGQNWLVFLAITVTGQISFYLAQRAQYLSGHFVLGYVNAVDEGMILLQAIMLFTGIVGQEFWVQLFLGYTYGEILIRVLLVVAAGQGIVYLVQGLETSNNKNAPNPSQLDSLWCCLTSCLTFVFIAAYSPTDILNSHSIIIQIGLSLLFSKMTLHVQIASISGQRLQFLHTTFYLGNGLYILNYGAAMLTGNTLVDEIALIHVVNCIALFSYAHTVYGVTNHIARILGIRIFLINPPRIPDNQKVQYVEVPKADAQSLLDDNTRSTSKTDVEFVGQKIN